ncbi:hypothetical protein ANCCAN_22042 [Ancylostoma caninum]|uniref:Uncharacterized protein n=1 Tax=Ancylostoma caninum TaxID=29170 RepID=A0A368FMY5_ANCCA|nr:hypothetical protein ANCCAN_22042 [Ancylostoma caninum]
MRGRGVFLYFIISIGIGLGKRADLFRGEKKALSSFDTLAGIGLGKRSKLFTRQYYVPYRAILEDKLRREQN